MPRCPSFYWKKSHKKIPLFFPPRSVEKRRTVSKCARQNECATSRLHSRGPRHILVRGFFLSPLLPKYQRCGLFAMHIFVNMLTIYKCRMCSWTSCIFIYLWRMICEDVYDIYSYTHMNMNECIHIHTWIYTNVFLNMIAVHIRVTSSCIYVSIYVMHIFVTCIFVNMFTRIYSHIYMWYIHTYSWMYMSCICIW